MRPTQPTTKSFGCENGQPSIGLRASGGDCLITPCCRLRGMLSKATAAFLAVLDDCTVADLVRDNEGLARLLGMRAA